MQNFWKEWAHINDVLYYYQISILLEKSYSKYLFGYKNDAEDLDNMIFILEISLST